MSIKKISIITIIAFIISGCGIIDDYKYNKKCKEWDGKEYFCKQRKLLTSKNPTTTFGRIKVFDQNNNITSQCRFGSTSEVKKHKFYRMPFYGGKNTVDNDGLYISYPMKKLEVIECNSDKKEKIKLVNLGIEFSDIINGKMNYIGDFEFSFDSSKAKKTLNTCYGGFECYKYYLYYPNQITVTKKINHTFQDLKIQAPLAINSNLLNQAKISQNKNAKVKIKFK